MKLIRILLLFQTNILVGGQAVIEGVMMRVPGAYSTAVRNPEGKIITDRHHYTSIIDRHSKLKKPIIRGIIGLYEALRIGLSTLQWSADIAEPMEKEGEKKKIIDSLVSLFAIAIAISIFLVLPILLTSWMFDKDNNPVTFNLISGTFRILFFISYLLLISMMKDVQRLFQYHGAEHKAIYTFEAGLELTVMNTYKFPTQHPRCGTSFLFIVMLIAIISFAFIDFILIKFVGDLNPMTRILFHLPMIPPVAGIGYEVLKATAQYRDFILFRIFAAPGLWLQHITTKSPNDEQMSVALEALKSAFGEKLKDYEGKVFTAEAIG